MEIGQFLRSRPRATVVVLLFPLLAAVITGIVLASQPGRYTAEANVSVPGSSADSSSRVGIFIANFAEVAASSPVVTEVASDTGEPASQITDGLEVARIGQSSIFSVTYTGDRRRTVEPVVRSVISTTFTRLLPVAATNEAQQAAVRAYQDAEQALKDYQDEIGTLQPDQDYSDVSSRIRSLQASAASASTAASAAAQRAQIAQLTAQRDALVPQIRRMQQLEADLEDAASQRSEAYQAAAAARQDAEAAQSPSTIRDLVVEAAPRTSRILQGAGVAAVVGLLVSIAVFLVSDPARRRRMLSPERPQEAAAPQHRSLEGAGRSS